MFQSAKQRITAEDKPICVSCKKEKTCTIENNHGWRYVLSFCQEYEAKDNKLIN